APIASTAVCASRGPIWRRSSPRTRKTFRSSPSSMAIPTPSPSWAAPSGSPSSRSASTASASPGPDPTSTVTTASTPPPSFAPPGHEEDLAGHPFVGPAGRLLDRALAAASIAREDVYVTNVVKHFKWEPRGKRRIHAKPNQMEIAACLPWLEAELEVVEPDAVVCLGATAAQALLGPRFRVTKQRGQWVRALLAERVLATVHPSAILRA